MQMEENIAQFDQDEKTKKKKKRYIWDNYWKEQLLLLL